MGVTNIEDEIKIEEVNIKLEEIKKQIDELFIDSQFSTKFPNDKELEFKINLLYYAVNNSNKFKDFLDI